MAIAKLASSKDHICLRPMVQPQAVACQLPSPQGMVREQSKQTSSSLQEAAQTSNSQSAKAVHRYIRKHRAFAGCQTNLLNQGGTSIKCPCQGKALGAVACQNAPRALYASLNWYKIGTMPTTVKSGAWPSSLWTILQSPQQMRAIVLGHPSSGC
jgi:hypothetical protein